MKELWNNIFHHVYYHPLDNYYHHHHRYMYAYIQKSIYTAHPEFRPLRCCKISRFITLSHKLLLNKTLHASFVEFLSTDACESTYIALTRRWNCEKLEMLVYATHCQCNVSSDDRTFRKKKKVIIKKLFIIKTLGVNSCSPSTNFFWPVNVFK